MSLESSFAEFEAREQEKVRKWAERVRAEEARKQAEAQKNRVYFFNSGADGRCISGISIDMGPGLPPHTKLVRYPADAAIHEQKVILLDEASPLVYIRTSS